MGMAISDPSARGHAVHIRAVNFGQLNSAIARGDLAAAQMAFVAIHESASPAAAAAKAKGPLEAVGLAIASGDVVAAKQTLADLNTGRAEPPPAAPEPEAATLPLTELAPQGISDQVDTVSTPTVLALLAERNRRSGPSADDARHCPETVRAWISDQATPLGDESQA